MTLKFKINYWLLKKLGLNGFGLFGEYLLKLLFMK